MKILRFMSQLSSKFRQTALCLINDRTSRLPHRPIIKIHLSIMLKVFSASARNWLNLAGDKKVVERCF